MNKKIIPAVLAFTTFGLIGSQGDAATWPNNTVSELQTAKLADGVHHVVFKGCNGATCFWWTAVNNAMQADSVRALATTAFLTHKKVNLQCGAGTGNTACSCQNSSVFENNALVSKCVYNIDNMQVID